MYKVLLGLHIFFVIVEGIEYVKKGRRTNLLIGLANAFSATKIILDKV